MSIQNYVNELKDINTEIKRLKGVTSDLKKRSMQIEKNIISYLNEKNIPGVKDKDTAIIIENKKKRISVSKKSAEQESIKILESHGIMNAKNVLNEIPIHTTFARRAQPDPTRSGDFACASTQTPDTRRSCATDWCVCSHSATDGSRPPGNRHDSSRQGLAGVWGAGQTQSVTRHASRHHRPDAI